MNLKELYTYNFSNLEDNEYIEFENNIRLPKLERLLICETKSKIDFLTNLKLLYLFCKNEFPNQILELSNLEALFVFGEYKNIPSDISKLTNLGRPKILGANSALEAQATLIGDLTQRFGVAAENVARKYRDKLIGTQLISKRLADCAIELFVALSTLSRVSNAMSKGSALDEQRILKALLHQIETKVGNNLNGLTKNCDSEILALADSMRERGGFTWDCMRE